MKNFFTLFFVFLLTMGFVSQSFAQIRGTITDAGDGSPLPGVNIVVKGTTVGTTTGADGTYTINATSGQTLVFTYVGYLAQEVSVGASTTIDVSLESDTRLLEDVVVVGYGEQDKKDVTGSISTVSAKDFNGGVITSPEQLIQGRAAGVQITSSSGEPGAGINVRIRGTSSIRNGNNPLFVVDGVPLSGDDVSAGGSTPLGNSSPRNPLNFLNPNDIADITILKDASATAIYGSRGANGVVLVTTKSGKGGKGTLTYNSEVSVSTISKRYDLLGREAFLDAYEALNSAAARAQLDQGADTDWQDEIFRTAISHNHNISFGAGDATGNYRFSVGYLDQQGIIDESGLKRFTARFNGSKKFIKDRLTISTQMTISDIRDLNVPVTNNAGFEGDLLAGVLKFRPSNPVFDINDADNDGNTEEFYQPNVTEPNPRAYLALSEDVTKTIRALGNISAEFVIAKGFAFKTVLGLDRSFSSRKGAFSRDLIAGNDVTGSGRLFLTDIQIDNRLWENYFTYNGTFGKLEFSGLLGYSYQSFVNEGKYNTYLNFQTSDLDLMINNYASAALSGGGNSYRNADELQSFFGRFVLNFSEKYIFTGTLRSDGSTRFGSGNQYGYFPSFAFKWRIGDESFAPDLFSDLSLRLGYGITGNQEIPRNQYDRRQRYGDRNVNNAGTFSGGGLGVISFQNPDLKWESTTQFGVGIDFGFLNNRLTGAIDYYYKNTNDLLVQIQSAQPAAQPFVWTNLDADIVNTGVELSLNFVAIDQADFTWNILGNVAYNKNEVKNFGGLINTGEINGQGLTGAFAQRIAEGQPLYAFFLREFGGFDSEGNSLYPNGDVQVFTGDSPLPTVTAGLTNTFTYKGWDLSFFFTGLFGHSIYSNNENAFFTAGALANGRNVTTKVVGNGEGGLNAPDVSTRFVQKGDFVRLQNANLGYNVKLGSNSAVTSLRFYINAQNLFVITGYDGQDPEVNTNKSLNGVPSAGIDYTAYPRARTFTFGVNIGF